jgi:hypothetical protein
MQAYIKHGERPNIVCKLIICNRSYYMAILIKQYETQQPQPLKPPATQAIIQDVLPFKVVL